MYINNKYVLPLFAFAVGLILQPSVHAKPPTAAPVLIVTLTCGYDAVGDRLVVEAIDASDGSIASDVSEGDACIDTYARLHARVSRASDGVVNERLQPGELAGSPATVAPDCVIFDIIGGGVHDGATVTPTSQAFLTCNMTTNGGLALVSAESNDTRLLGGLSSGMSCAAARSVVAGDLQARGRNMRVSQGMAGWFRSVNDPTGVVLHRIGLAQK